MQPAKPILHLLIALISLAWSCPARALVFSKIEPRPGVVVLRGSGAIEEGDVERFLAAAPLVTQDGNGYRRIILESPGGDVNVAMRVAALLRQWSFITFVDADCASACAMILFPAGVYSVLGDNGRLGFHNCFSAITGTIARECTDAIAEFTARQGMPYGSIKIFAGLRGAGEMFWVTNVLAYCYGFERLPGDQAPVTLSALWPHAAFVLIGAKQMSPSAIGPSFDCRRPEDSIARLLCTDEELMHLDALMGRLFRYARKLDRSPDQTVLVAQRAWIKARNAACPVTEEEAQSLERSRSAARCISEKTMLRMNELLNTLGRPRFDFSKALEYGREGWKAR